MTVSIRNVVPDFLAFERVARVSPASEWKTLWNDYADRHRLVFDSYVRIGGEPPRVQASLARLIGNGGVFEQRALRTASLIRAHVPSVLELMDAGPVELGFVIMVGLFRADGWFDDLGETPAAFFAVEQFKETPWDEVTVVHETTHLVHARVQPERWPDEQIGFRLLLEGLAISATHELLPGCPAWAHWNFRSDEVDDWLQACAAAEPLVDASVSTCRNSWRS